MLRTLSDKRVDFLTNTGRKYLPSGYWQNPDQSPDANCHLTFDDGPFPETTPQLLEILAEHGVTATFFFTGFQASKHPELVKRAAQAGHQIGNHGYWHLPSPFIPVKVLEREIDSTNDIYMDIIGTPAAVFRPPYGIIDRRGTDCLAERDMVCVYWTAFAEDWSEVGYTEVTRRIMRQLNPGKVVVLHESNVTSKQCLDSTVEIVKSAHDKGFKFGPILSGFQ